MGFFDFLKRKRKDDGPHTHVIDDDTVLAGKSDDDDVILESEIEDSRSDVAPDAKSKIDSDTAPDPGAEDDEDIEFPDFDDDIESGGASKKGARVPMQFVIIGTVVLFIGVISGVGFWFLGSGDEITNTELSKEAARGKSVGMAIPPRNPQKDGGLNAIDQRVQKSTAPKEDIEKVTHEAVRPEQTTPQSGLKAITGSMAGSGSLNASAEQIQNAAGQGLVIPSVTSGSYEKVPDQTKVVPLATAPDLLLAEAVGGLLNPLPIIGADERQPWQVYARPFVSRTKYPKVAFVVKGLGYSRAATMAAIKKLPGEVSLAFSPYVEELNDWMLRARLSGHEVFLELPMESKNFPVEDAGPMALNTNFQVEDNIKQLNEVMSRMTGYVGLLSVMGSKFNEAEGQLKPILAEVKRRGLMFIDGGGSWSLARRVATEIELPIAYPNVYLDDPPSRHAMDQKLLSLNKIAHSQGGAIAIIHAYPNSIERLLSWIESMEDRKLTLAPVSALANTQIVK